MKTLIWMLLLAASSGAQDLKPDPTGSVRGVVRDRETHSPLIGVNILLLGTKQGTVSHEAGIFEIPHVPVGSYVGRVSLIGYETEYIPDIVVRPGRATQVEAGLKPGIVQVSGAEVTAGYYGASEGQPSSVATFSFEEIRRSPAAGGDVSRIIMTMPSVAQINDQANGLVVRGGSPMENAFFVDGIEVPNINHFPTQGSSGGGIAVINVDLVREMTFRAGGFGPAYGDRLSSVVELELRDGDEEKARGAADLSFAGIGFVGEGPLASSGGNWLISVRRSYIDLISRILRLGVTPQYGDFAGRASYTLGPADRLEFLELGGVDINDITREQSKNLDFSVYGNETHIQNSTGIRWQHLVGGSGFVNASLSHTMISYSTDFNDGVTGGPLIDNRSLEQRLALRLDSRFESGERAAVEFGAEVKYLADDFRVAYGASVSPLGQALPPSVVRMRPTAITAGFSANVRFHPIDVIELSAGARSDYHSLTGRRSVSPRGGISFALSGSTSLTVAAGIYRQTLPMLTLTQQTDLKSLDDLSATHYVLGFHHLLTEDTKLTLEVYDKFYRHLPVDPAQPSLSMVDEILLSEPFLGFNDRLVSAGEASSRGVEFSIQKKLAVDFYGIVSASLFQARYRNPGEPWRERIFNNRYILSADGGYKPNPEWEFSARWVFAGGTPYTPFDEAASRAIDRGVLDGNAVNARRQPDYHSLNLRVDRRFHFAATTLVSYVSMWNVYDRKNVASYYWNEYRNEVGTQYQWGFVPVFGLEYDF